VREWKSNSEKHVMVYQQCRCISFSLLCFLLLSTAANPACTTLNAMVCFSFTWAQSWFALATLGNPAPTWSTIAAGGDSSQGIVATFNNGAYGPNTPTLDMQFICSTTSSITAEKDPSSTDQPNNNYHCKQKQTIKQTNNNT
jgi:hypothetical protein